jgi:ribose-phosphate pyrophosphokinase
MIATGGTIAESVEALLRDGARSEIFVAATHGLMLEGAGEVLSHPAIRAVYVTDTVPLRLVDWSKIHVVSIAPLIAGAIQRFMTSGAIRDLVL